MTKYKVGDMVYINAKFKQSNEYNKYFSDKNIMPAGWVWQFLAAGITGTIIEVIDRCFTGHTNRYRIKLTEGQVYSVDRFINIYFDEELLTRYIVSDTIDL